MFRTLTILAFSLFAANTFAATDSILRLSLQATYPFVVNDFTTDNLGNIYLVTASNQVKKINEKGDSIGVFNDVKRYGKIYSVDATNPLKVLVFYKDFSTIVALDRLMNVRNTIDLRKQNMQQVRAVTTSYDNNIWLFDDMESKLKKIDDNGRVMMESVDLRQAFEAAPAPDIMFDRDGQLFLYDIKMGLFVFDYYGAFRQKHSISNVLDLQVIHKQTITGRDSTRIILYKPATFQTFHFSAFVDPSIYKKIRFKENKIYALTHDGALNFFVVE